MPLELIIIFFVVFALIVAMKLRGKRFAAKVFAAVPLLYILALLVNILVAIMSPEYGAGCGSDSPGPCFAYMFLLQMTLPVAIIAGVVAYGLFEAAKKEPTTKIPLAGN